MAPEESFRQLGLQMVNFFLLVFCLLFVLFFTFVDPDPQSSFFTDPIWNRIHNTAGSDQWLF